eukprot:TRINITY_DN7493_c0_g1_i1.p1 TRINITY_DN7493_c0_g1~~TRINITY_DN7493_c0_g1_i1.p1  ORF type:complete len:356 (+),score=116.17 TRINITY_DN7493_c0_g1_i1:125-1192(+)
MNRFRRDGPQDSFRPRRVTKKEEEEGVLRPDHEFLNSIADGPKSVGKGKKKNKKEKSGVKGGDAKGKKRKRIYERSNERLPTQFRHLFIKTGVVSQADGSAYVEFNNTKVICSVYGPRASPTMSFSPVGQLHCEFKFSTFSCDEQRRKYTQDKEEKDYSLLLEQSIQTAVRLAKYPKSVIDVNVLVLQSDGGSLGAGITCASLAIADAGIEMFDLVASCAAGVIDGNVLLDLDDAEENHFAMRHVKKKTGAAEDGDDDEESEGETADAVSGGSLCVAYMPERDEMTQLFQQGQLDHDDLHKAMDLTLDGCRKLYVLMRQHLMDVMMSKAVEAGGAGAGAETGGETDSGDTTMDVE